MISDRSIKNIYIGRVGARAKAAPAPPPARLLNTRIRVYMSVDSLLLLYETLGLFGISVTGKKILALERS